MRLIDADAVIEQVKIDRKVAGCFYKGVDEILDVVFDAVIDSITDAKTIDPVKHGRWVMRPTISSVPQCSECRGWGDRWSETMDKYCPYCGAKMDLEE